MHVRPLTTTSVTVLTLGLLVAMLSLTSSPFPVSAAPLVADTFHGLAPTRVLDTRADGVTVDGQFQAGGAVGTGQVVQLTVAGRAGVPTGAAAVAMNVTVTEPTSAGYLTVYPNGSSIPNAANVNFTVGATVGNTVIVPIGSAGAVSLFNSSGDTQIVVDVLGWFPSTNAFSGLTPARVLDTRAGFATIDGQFAGIGASGPGTTRQVTVAGRAGVPTGAAAVALNVAVTGPTSGGYLTLFPAGAAVPNAANVNFQPGQTVSNLVIVPVGAAGQVSWFNSAGDSHVVVDVLGWFPTTSVITGLVPQRLLDTRADGVTIDGQAAGGGAVGGGSTIEVQLRGRAGIPLSAGAVALNVTVTEPSAATYLTVFPSGAPRPLASNLNADAGRTVPNLVIVPIGAGGRVSIHQHAGAAHVVVDVLAWFPTTAIPASTERVSLSPAPANVQIPAGREAAAPSMSDDGRFVVFVSNAALLPGQSPGLRSRIYVRDRVTGATELVDTSTAGVESNSDSYRPSITADGRYVVFASAGTNLAPGPSIPGSFGVYRKDRWLGTTIRVDLTPAGAVSDAGLSSWPGIDDSGRYVVFRSDATNLVAGDTNGQPDVFRRDLTTGTTVRVSVSSSGAQATGGLSTLPSISGDGRFVLFESAASNLVPGDTNNAGDAFLRDLDAGTTTRVSVATGGVQAIGGGTSDSALDDSGRYVAFRSSATNLVPGDVNGQADVFVHDVLTNRTTRVSIDSNGLAGNGPSSAPSISDGGRSVSFVSTATNLVAGDTNTSADVFVHDRATGTTTRVSVTTAGAQATGNAQRSVISADGRAIAFDTPASLVAGDTNGILDVYVRDLGVAALFG